MLSRRQPSAGLLKFPVLWNSSSGTGTNSDTKCDCCCNLKHCPTIVPKSFCHISLSFFVVASCLYYIKHLHSSPGSKKHTRTRNTKPRVDICLLVRDERKSVSGKHLGLFLKISSCVLSSSCKLFSSGNHLKVCILCMSLHQRVVTELFTKILPGVVHTIKKTTSGHNYHRALWKVLFLLGNTDSLGGGGEGSFSRICGSLLNKSTLVFKRGLGLGERRVGAGWRSWGWEVT